MYSSRPSKQQQKKGIEFIKKLIKSQNEVKSIIARSDILNESQTQMKDILIQSHKVPLVKASHSNLHQLNKLSSKDLKMIKIVNITNRQRIYNQNMSIQIGETHQQNSYRFKRRFVVDDRKMNNSLQNLRSLKLINGYSFTKSQQRTQMIVTKSQQQMGTFKNNNHLNKTKSAQSQSKSTLNSLINPKQIKLQQELKEIEFRLISERQGIKLTRRDFVQLLQKVKRRGNEIDGEMVDIDIKKIEMERQMQRLVCQDSERKVKVSMLSQEIEKLTTLLATEKSSFYSQSCTLRQQILSTQQSNSLTTRRIFHLKQQLIQFTHYKQSLYQKNQSTTSLLRQLISYQQSINSLNLQKQLKIHQNQQQIKQRLMDKILAEGKGEMIYQQLEKQMNVIKEYYKISQNSREFRRNVYRMVGFQRFVEEIKLLQNSNDYSQDIMNMYKSELWGVGMPTFLDEEVMYIQAPEVRKLKITLKQMDAKKQSLNQILKQKQRLVAALTFKSKRLGEQIEEMRSSGERKRQQEEIASQIDWGF